MALRAQRARLRLVEPTAPAAGGEAASADPAASPDASAPEREPGDDAALGAPLPATGTPTPAPVTADARGRGARKLDPAPGTGIAGLPDAQLVALGIRGEVGALEILYRRHVAFAIHLATRIEGSARDVEDIAHDAFLRAFERLGDLADPSAFRAWLGSIVVHKVRSRMRRTRILSVLGMGKSSEPVDLDAIASPDASPHARAQIAQIYALLQTLPSDERIAWILRSVEGHELEAVARLTGCSLATVKRRIGRAQHFLDEHFVDPTSSEVSS